MWELTLSVVVIVGYVKAFSHAVTVVATAPRRCTAVVVVDWHIMSWTNIGNLSPHLHIHTQYNLLILYDWRNCGTTCLSTKRQYIHNINIHEIVLCRENMWKRITSAWIAHRIIVMISSTFKYSTNKYATKLWGKFSTEQKCKHMIPVFFLSLFDCIWKANLNTRHSRYFTAFIWLSDKCALHWKSIENHRHL